MPELEVAIDHAEKFPCSCDDCQEVAIEKAHSEEDKHLAEATTKADVHTVKE